MLILQHRDDLSTKGTCFNPMLILQHRANLCTKGTCFNPMLILQHRDDLCIYKGQNIWPHSVPCSKVPLYCFIVSSKERVMVWNRAWATSLSCYLQVTQYKLSPRERAPEDLGWTDTDLRAEFQRVKVQLSTAFLGRILVGNAGIIIAVVGTYWDAAWLNHSHHQLKWILPMCT